MATGSVSLVQSSKQAGSQKASERRNPQATAQLERVQAKKAEQRAANEKKSLAAIATISPQAKEAATEQVQKQPESAQSAPPPAKKADTAKSKSFDRIVNISVKGLAGGGTETRISNSGESSKPDKKEEVAKKEPEPVKVDAQA